MAGSEALQSRDAVAIPVGTMQAVGDRLRERVSAWVARRRSQVGELVADAAKVPGTLRERAERALRDLDVRRAQVLASLETQAAALAETVAKRLRLLSRDEIVNLQGRMGELTQRLDALTAVLYEPSRNEVAELQHRIVELEERLDALTKERGASSP